MTPGIALLVIGGILLVSGWKNQSLSAVFDGTDEKDASGAVPVVAPIDSTTINPATGNTLTVPGSLGTMPMGVASPLGPLSRFKTAEGLITSIVLPLARRNKMVTGRNATMVRAANATHGPTVSGGRSDHQGPPKVAWATDMSNGGSPTREMDQLARDIANVFGIPWNGSGLVNHTAQGWRMQLIYRTDQGGNHYNHVHFGVKKV